jgi:sigma-B regulation protein RsbU (phosphoserine phosphatase)
MVGRDAYEKRIENGQVTLSPEDWIVLYTDGINEAQNSRGEEFGTERFLEVVRANRRLRPGELIREVLRRHGAFAGDVPQFDDMTLIAVKWSGNSADTHTKEIMEQSHVA